MAEIATKKVGAEPGLVPRLAGGGSSPGENSSACWRKFMTYLKLINDCIFWERWKLTFSSMTTMNGKQIPFMNICYENLCINISYVMCLC